MEIDDKRSYVVKASEDLSMKDYAPAETLAGTKKSKLAMDACVQKAISPLLNMGIQSVGTRFVGYPVLANLSQEALIRAGVEVTADEMTRKFVNFRYDSENGQDGKEEFLNKMSDLYKKYHVKETFNEAMKKTGYFGGCLVYIDMGIDDEDMETPLILDKKTFKKGSFKGFKVVEPINVCPAQYNSTDPLDKHYYKPEIWWVMQRRVHSSRFLYFSQNDTPMLLKAAYNFFGIPSAQLALDYVANFTANRESAQKLLNKFSLTCWKTPLGQGTAKGWLAKLKDRVLLFNKMRNNQGTIVLDKETEELMQINTPLSGVKDIVEMSLNLLCAIWHMPKILYLGEGEGGLNASSAKQLQVWYDWILSQKEKIFDGPLGIVNKILQLNEGLEPDENLAWDYPSMVEMDETERANLNKSLSDRDNSYINSGVISREEVRQRLSLDKNSGYTDIDVDELPDMSEMNPLDGEDTPDDDNDPDNNLPKGGKANDEDLAFDMVDGNGRTHDEQGRFAKESSSSRPEEWGEAFEEYSDDPEGAIDKLLKEKRGYVPDAIYKKGIGLIDFVWGVPGPKNTEKGYGISHIIRRRTEENKDGIGFVKTIPSIIRNGKKYENPSIKDRIYIETKDKSTSIRLDWDGKDRKWLVSAWVKKSGQVEDGEFFATPSLCTDNLRFGRLPMGACPSVKNSSTEEEKSQEENIAMDEKWITVKHNHDNPEEKGRHILLEGEGENQETPAEAMKRQWGVDLTKKKEKEEPKPEEKKEEPKETKPEPKPEEKKEPQRVKTTTQEYAELLEKEKAGELSESEKARKKELEEKEGFGESEEKKEKSLQDMTDEELETKEKELDNQYKDMMQRRKEALAKAKEEDKELNDLQKEYDELQQKSYKIDYYTDEGHEISRKMDEVNDKINKRRDEIFDDVDKKFDKEYKEISDKLHPVQMEKYNREQKKEEISLKKRNDFMDKFSGIMTKADEMSDEDFIKGIKDIEEAVKNSDMSDRDKEVALSQMSTRSGKVMFDKKSVAIGKKVKEYSKTTDALVKEFESFDDPYEKWSKEREAARMKLVEMRDQRDKEQDPEKKKKLDTEITMQILNAHFSVEENDLNKIKYDRSMAVANILRKQNNTGSRIEEGKSTIKGVFDKLNGILGGVIGKNIRTDDAPRVQAMRGRAYYSASDNMFKVQKDSDFGDVIHEYTHFLERNNSKMLANSLAFAEYRTKGENYESLSKLTGNRAYKGTEIAKKDRFFSPYCGKIYSSDQEYRTGRASEIMSMGVERLFREPAKFAKEDREYFDFVIANLRGEL